MKLQTELHADQKRRWPPRGRHILAQFDDDSVVVYQAYRPSIGDAALRDQRFGGGGFSLSRMSWIKPNFLWMMYRCGWGTKEGQEVVLAVRLKRAAFDEILSGAVASSQDRRLFESREDWRRALSSSQVRLQWDPDHSPKGGKLERRALQLGLRGEVLRRYAGEWILSIEDISDFVAQQRDKVGTAELITPREEVYPVADPEVTHRLGIDESSVSKMSLEKGAPS